MIIYRNNIAIELSSKEVYAIHRVHELDLLTEDAESQLLDWINSEDMAQDSKLRDDFISAYGFTPEDAISKESEHYLLSKLVSLYEEHHDCNVAENDTWRIVICECLAGLKKHLTTDAN